MNGLNPKNRESSPTEAIPAAVIVIIKEKKEQM